MGISSSMNAGVSGLNANANKLATISDNIANSQTYGYKRADVDFSSMTISDSKSPNTVGGGRWFTAGGVQTQAIWDVERKGAITTTSNSTDLAITGRGFLPVTDLASIDSTSGEQPLMLTTTGSFSTERPGLSHHDERPRPARLAGGRLRQRHRPGRDTASGLEPVRVNISSVAVQPTTEIALNANLPTDDVEAGADGATRDVTVEYFDNVGGSQALTASFAPTVPAAGDPRSNEWTLTLTDQATGQSAGTYTLVFSDTAPNAGGLASVTGPTGGTLASSYDATTGEMSLNLGNQALTIAIGSTDPNGPRNLSQLSSTFSSVGVSHDGNAAGTFTGLSIDEKGLLSATYSTGFSQVIYQIPIADVPNPNGLKVLDNQCFALSQASGGMFLWDAGDGPTGSIEGFAREQSTTDIAKELTQLIQTQRAYSSNAKIIQTVDEMLQETTNLKR